MTTPEAREPELDLPTFTTEQLLRAWSEVLANDAADGMLSAGVERFERNLDDEIGGLVAELAWSSYRPGLLTEVRIPKDDGVRVLHVPPVRDRVVERALLVVSTPRIEPHLGAWSYAYRPGLGVADAIAAVVALRDEGMTHVLRADIDDCFPTIPVRLAARLFDAAVCEVVVAVAAAVPRAFRAPAWPPTAPCARSAARQRSVALAIEPRAGPGRCRSRGPGLCVGAVCRRHRRRL